MRSLEIHAPGDLRLVEKEPTAPGPGQVRLAVEYGGICGSDLGYWRTGVSGTAVMKRPFVLGHEISPCTPPAPAPRCRRRWWAGRTSTRT